ncbi:hypothetical protein [Leptospira johnsonii]|uniref:Uncharacterized protein n=1 Tax=Leptospira johnsonii TaxID=1917820 RepID=A0A2P2D7N4_9LEPT|nr:hypothetical protein [Leptospira johnsonii]GBF40645.1 hypothetical protein LPTSP1_36630 [Leptospira johnsonii]
MNEQEAIAKFKGLIEEYGGDTEMLHIYVDNLVADFIEQNGAAELAKIYRNNCKGFWYA